MVLGWFRWFNDGFMMVFYDGLMMVEWDFMVISWDVRVIDLPVNFYRTMGKDPPYYSWENNNGHVQQRTLRSEITRGYHEYSDTFYWGDMKSKNATIVCNFAMGL